MLNPISTVEFESRYRLMDRVGSEGVQTYRAESPDGRLVLVHFLGPSGLPANRVRLDRLDALALPEKANVLEMLDIEGHIVLVTELLAGFESLDRWLDNPGRGRESETIAFDSSPTVAIHPKLTDLRHPPEDPTRSTAGEPIGQAPQTDPGEATPDHGEFTSLFAPLEPPSAPDTGPGSHAPPEPPASVGREPAAEAPSVQTGEFTHLFKPVAGGASEPAATRPAEPEGPTEVQPALGGQVGPEPEVGDLGAPGDAGAADASEIPTRTSAEPAGVSGPTGAEDSARPSPPAGEFTQLFGAPDSPQAAESPADAAPAERPGEPPSAEPPTQEDPQRRKPRIKWREPTPDEAPDEPQVKVRWKDPTVPATESPPQPAEPPARGPSADAPVPPRAEPQGAGEFTRLFGQSVDRSAPGPASPHSAPEEPVRSFGDTAPPAPTADGPPPSAAPPGEFTRFFGSSDRPEERFQATPDLGPESTQPRPSMSRGRSPELDRPSAEYLRALGYDAPTPPADPGHRPAPPQGAPTAPGASPPLPPPAASPPAGPTQGEYTRIIQGAAPVAPVPSSPVRQPSPRPPTAAPPAPGPGKMPLVVALVVIAVLAVALVLVVVL